MKNINLLLKLFEQATHKLVKRVDGEYHVSLTEKADVSISIEYIERTVRKFINKRIESCTELADTAPNGAYKLYFLTMADNWKNTLEMI